MKYCYDFALNIMQEIAMANAEIEKSKLTRASRYFPPSQVSRKDS